METIEIKDTNIKKILSVDGITVIDFWAPWCSPCNMFSPTIDKLASLNKDIQVGKLNVDENGTIAASYGIRRLPTIIIFKDGREVNKFSGIKSLDELQVIVEGYK